MTEKTTKLDLVTNAFTILFVVLTVVVAGLCLAIWFDPALPVNPFPPAGARVAAPSPTPQARAVAQHPANDTAAYPPTWTPAPTSPVVAPTRVPRSTPLPTRTPTPTPKPDPLWRYYISGMRGRRFPGGTVELHGLFGKSPDFTTYLIFYNSQGLRIGGMMNVPNGRGPYPVIILCHGYIHPEKYATGNGTWLQADYLARNGYITIAPDYRNHAASDDAVSFFHIGYTEDVLNLISSLHTVKKADADRIGLWGHSMGGAVALKSAVVSKKVDAVVLFGSVSADERVNFAYGMGNGSGAYGTLRFGTPKSNNLSYKRISPINYLHFAPPLSIHHGTGDSIVPYEWSEDLFAAAEKEGMTVELFLYPDAEHTFRDDDWDLAMSRTLTFFDDHVKN